jgi:predicted MFS family arabinose efflux permease
MLHPRRDAELEEVEDALVDGGVAYQRGTAQAALRHRDFRIVYGGTFASNVGTWMQNVILGAYAWDLTHSGTFVGLVFFGQLGPLLFLSLTGGALADTVDRRRLLVGMQVTQGLLSAGLAAVAWTADPSRALVVAIVFAIGIANALGAPGLSAILPRLVPREDLSGAVALMSVQMNLSRVIGPAIGGLLYERFDAGPVFALNAATYGFAVAGLLAGRYPRRTNAQIDERGLARLLSGVRIARNDPLISHVLATLFSFSFFSLAFIGIMPVIAKANLDVEPKSLAYGLLYACFGLGAAAGAVTVGTVLAHRSKVALLRPGFVAFALLLALFGFLRDAAPAFPVVAVLGYVYFVVITCLSTVLQHPLPDEVRGRVMALWIMGFGGTVPLGVLAAGPLAQDFGTEVLLVGATWAIVLAAWSNAGRLREKGATDV